MQRVRYAFLLTAAAFCVFAADQPLDQLRALERSFADNPNSASATRELAHAYALALLKADPNAARYAADALDTSKHVWILGNAAYMLQCQYNDMLQRGTANERAAMLAERYFLRARSLDPKLDRQAILPKIDLQQVARDKEAKARDQREWPRRFEAAAKQIKRLGPDAFHGLPAGIRDRLRSRNCTIPQPALATTPLNVISGEFFERGQQSWAVLCSVNGWSAILVFRTAQDDAPQSLSRREDRNYLQSLDQNLVGYSRDIRAVGRDFILAHDRGQTGPKPTRITHQGIDDAFLEKASEVWYHEAGKWFKLPGAD